MLQLVNNYPFVTTHSFSRFLPPKDKHYELTKDYALGGKVLSLENQDKNTHVYCTEVRKGNEIWFWREDKGVDTAKLYYTTSQPIRQLSLALDQLNSPQFCFTLNDGTSYIYWFSSSNWELTPIPYSSPKIVLDYLLKDEAPISDVCCFATDNGALYVAYQRNGYLTWTKLAEDSTKNMIFRVGHTGDNRIGIMWR